MSNQTIFIAIGILLLSAVGAAANSAERAEPLLRQRLDHPVITKAAAFQLRPRLTRRVQRAAVPPRPQIQLMDDGAVGKLAAVSTPHPNLVLTLGAVHTPNELGRQIDRAIVDAKAGPQLFHSRKDSAPFIGIGLRNTAPKRGFSIGGSIGAALLKKEDASRLAYQQEAVLRGDFELDARANLRLRYTF